MKQKRKVVSDVTESMKRNLAKVVRSWSSTHWHVEEIDLLASEIKNTTGVHCDRSKILNALAEVLVEHKGHLDLSRIVDPITLKDEIVAAMKK
jgi:hypothetical protein